MRDYKQKGNDFHDRTGNKVASIRGDWLWSARNLRVARIHGNDIFNEKQQRVATIRAAKVYDEYNRVIGDVDDVRNQIDDAMGGASVVAFWLFFVR